MGLLITYWPFNYGDPSSLVKWRLNYATKLVKAAWALGFVDQGGGHF